MHYTIKTNANAMKINKVKFGAYFQHISTEKRKLTLKFSTLFERERNKTFFYINKSKYMICVTDFLYFYPEYVLN